MDQTYGIYGMGRTGCALYRSLREHGMTSLHGFVRSKTKQEFLAKKFEPDLKIFSETQVFLDSIGPNALLFLAVPDDAISEVAQYLSSFRPLPTTVMHLSGVLSYRVLAPLEPYASTAQFHPMVSLDGESPIPACTLTGIGAEAPEVRTNLCELASILGLTPSLIKEGSEPLYHAAAVLTGNLSLALVADSLTLMEQAGIPADIARPALAKLFRSAANNVEKLSIGEALTGPLARGDLGTLDKHLSALKNSPMLDDIQTTYQQLSAKLLPLTLISDEKKKQIRELLKKK